MNDEVATIADIDKGAATVNVVPTNVPAEGTKTPPAADSAQAAPVAAPTEAQDGAAPGTDQPKPAEGDEPEWFKKRLTDISRQRRNEERRADKLAAELEALKRTTQPAPQSKPVELRAQDFPSYDAFTAAVAAQAGTAAATKAIEAASQASAEQQARVAQQRSIETFMEKATAQAEEADIDLDAVMETLSVQPLLSQTVVDHLAQSEQSARLAEHLALNPNDLHRISMMGPALAKKELAKVEAGFKPAAAKPPITKAPPPGPTVGGRGVAQKTVEDMGMKEFGEHFYAQEEARLKRM
jgi:hypothetical protein